MCVTNNRGKEFLKILWKNFFPVSSLYKIFNKNDGKLSYSCMPNVANLINKSNTKKLMNKQHKEPSKCNYINKTNCPLTDKCQYESVVYCDHNAIKKMYIGSIQDVF